MVESGQMEKHYVIMIITKLILINDLALISAPGKYSENNGLIAVRANGIRGPLYVDHRC